MNPIIDELRSALANVDYPAHKDVLVREAEGYGASEPTIKALRAMPPVEYGNIEEVSRSVDIDPAPDPSRKGAQARGGSHRNLADHMKDNDPPPIEQVEGFNKGS